MTTDLYFLVPVPRSETVAEQKYLYRCLETLFASFAGQTDGRYEMRVICEEGVDLPELPPRGVRFDVPISVGWPANWDPQDVQPGQLEEGRRLLAGLDGIDKRAFVMRVAPTDLLDREVVHTIQEGPAGPDGWVIDRGYIWFDGQSELYEADGLQLACASTVAVRAKYLKCFSSDVPREEMLMELGSMTAWFELLNQAGRTFSRLPYRGVIYRRGAQGGAPRTGEGSGAAWLGSARPGAVLESLKRIVGAERQSAPGPADMLTCHWDRSHEFSGELYRSMTGGAAHSTTTSAA